MGTWSCSARRPGGRNQLTTTLLWHCRLNSARHIRNWQPIRRGAPVGATEKLLRLVPVLVWILCALPVAGCSISVNEQPYPSDWPALAQRVEGCAGISGIYLDRGTRTAVDGKQATSSLAELLADTPTPTVQALRVEMPASEKISLIALDASRSAKVLSLRKGLSSHCRAGIPILASDHLTADPMATLREVIEISLFQASDRSLVAKRTYRASGYMFFTPISDRSVDWFRFARIDE